MAASAAELRQHYFTETYTDVEKLVYSTVHEFIGRYGGEFEELVSEANLAFVIAYHRYTDGTSKFSYWVRYIIWKLLLEQQRNKLRRSPPQPNVSLHGDDGEIVFDRGDHPQFCLMEFLDELTEDAKIVTLLAVDTPLGLTKQMVEKGGSGMQRRAVLRDYLEGLGWTAERIKESFTEIGALLKHFP